MLVKFSDQTFEQLSFVFKVETNNTIVNNFTFFSTQNSQKRSKTRKICSKTTEFKNIYILR